MSSELDADAQVGASQLTELDADASNKSDAPKDEEAAVTPVVDKSANHKSSLKESIMSHNLERDHVSLALRFFVACVCLRAESADLILTSLG